MVQVIQRSFTSGELAPGLRVRVDLGKYASGLTKCKNFFCSVQGGVHSRPGLRFVGELGDSTKVGRLIPFSFNVEQTYVLIFEHLKMRVVKNGGYVLAGGGPSVFELITPYTEDEIPDLAFTQSADVMTLVHPSHDPANLSRIADDNWTLANIPYTPTLSAITGLNVVAVGSGGGSYNKAYYYTVTAVDEDSDEESLPPVAVNHTVSSYTSTYGGRVTWNTVGGADYYKIYKSSSGNNEVFGLIGESRTLTFDDFNIEPDVTVSPPSDRTPFIGVDNKPSTVNYYQQRQIYAATNNEPQTLFTTQTGNFSSLRTSSPARADDAVTLTVANRQVNQIRHMVALDALILLTSGGEWIVTEGNDEVLAPDTVGVRPQSYNGSSKVPPVVINDSVVYVQNKGSTIRDFGYSFTSDKYSGNDLSIMSKHLFVDCVIKEMAYSSEPNGILWCVKDDGNLLGMTYQREHQVWGWHQHDTQGTFESVTVVSEGNRDAMYCIVKRNINGNDVRYIERMEHREEVLAEDCFYVDSGLSYEGSPVTTISGLTHLEGEQVTILADGNEVQGLTVNGGSITIPRAASKVHVGLSYVPEIITLGIDDNQAVIRGREKSTSDVRIIVNKSRGGWVGPVNDLEDEARLDSEMLEIKPRFASDGYDTLKLKSFEQRINIQPGWNDNGMIRIIQKAPLPLSILAIIPDVDIGG